MSHAVFAMNAVRSVCVIWNESGFVRNLLGYNWILVEILSPNYVY